MNHKPQIHITKTNTIKVIMTSRNIRSTASKRKTMGSTSMGTVTGMAVTMTSRDTTMPMPPTSIIRTAATTKAISKAIKTSITTISTMIKGRQLQGSNPSMVRVAMEPSQSDVVTIQKKTRRLSATSL